MKVLVCSPYPETLCYILRQHGDDPLPFNGPPDAWPEANYAVLFGYRHIIPPLLVSKFQFCAVNIHLSMLPWNRGADPNFWSWYTDSPKGVSLHYLTKGVDEGPIIDQQDCSNDFHDGTTLRSSYDHLRAIAILLFTCAWPKIREGGFECEEQDPKAGSFHKHSEMEAIRGGRWKNGCYTGAAFTWDTPVKDIVEMGRRARNG